MLSKYLLTSDILLEHILEMKIDLEFLNLPRLRDLLNRMNQKVKTSKARTTEQGTTTRMVFFLSLEPVVSFIKSITVKK